MKRWLALFGIVELATLGVLFLAPLLRRGDDTVSDRVQRVRPGMATDSVARIMHGEAFRYVHVPDCYDAAPLGSRHGLVLGERHYWEWPDHAGRGKGRHRIPVRVYFDSAGRVTRRSIGGKDL